ncbi:L-carnitine dehydrogenase [Halomonas sp. FeN2]|jgi:carnitine 3-dehydrogenase|uniref:L-carnitine dehydrogenase n=1 Tax=Vreelandella neptunia TaxID=115551 RepID=A0ABZ0YSK9_9GAMM|nr:MULTISPECIES: L-carnitine dehydrogenase [Halomonas]TDV99152.1 carnitine 3-dehydrogenase [Halomonas alkaliantarctica]MBF57585.1 3-hydroxybutyryl-CoA dehydrogenase [Halomonas sp.]MDN3559272.1 L-carnitine dehydrogenase [Halomonas neptunia]UBR49459.1 L-carnitine dehydrogenase [Halomonas sp. FeN2]WQH14231.1 L-carnitine dehydrogenase [Halomonas neptunia]
MSRLAVIGTGVIGNGWIARALAQGWDVVSFDPDPKAPARTQAFIDNAWPSLTQLGLAPDANPERLTFADTIEKAVDGADLIQENVPERLPLKQEILAAIDAAAPPDIIIGSSTSGFKPTDLQQQCQQAPGRVIVAHPFNPVYLLPLVELVGGETTQSMQIASAQRLYQALAMRPLVVRREIEGHIADRLMEALWREALHLVNDGVATTEEIDAAVVYGCGLRWPLMGTFLTFHLAGGEPGMRHMLEQFGPALKLPWTKLEAPELTDELIDKVVEGCEHQAAGRSVATLDRRRDDFLVELLEVVQKYWPEAEGLQGRI